MAIVKYQFPDFTIFFSILEFWKNFLKQSTFKKQNPQGFQNK